MRLPLLFAFIAFLLGGAFADTRPVPSPPSCTGSSSINTGCFCEGGCATSAQAWFSCHLDSTSTAVQDIGVRFEAGYAQPSQTRSWMLSNQAGWPGNSPTVDLYQPSVSMGTNPNGVAATPSYSGYTDTWYTSGTVQLSSSNPTGPGMWACTKDGILARNINSNFGPVQPRCYSLSTLAYTAPYSQGCQESLLFDAPTSGSLSYRGWGYAGLKVTTVAGVQPTADSPASLTIVPSSPLTATELRPLPLGTNTGLYNAGGVNMNCYVSLFNPCAQLGCAAGYVCVGSAFTPGSSTVTACPASNCCPASGVIRPTDGSAWYCCPSSKVIKTFSTFTNCCLSTESLDSKGACCPTAQLVNGVCCASAYFDSSKPNTCCSYQVATTGGQCCTTAGPYSSSAIPIANLFLSGATSYCCPATNINDQTGSNLACCPTTGGASANIYVDINVSGGATSNKYCCPAAQVVTSTVAATSGQKVCCPSSGGPFTYTSNNVNQCCPTTKLATCTPAQYSDPYCCSTTSTTCISTSGSADFNPCCPNAQVGSITSVVDSSVSNRCCSNYVSGVSYFWFPTANKCCVANYIVDISAQKTSSFSVPSGTFDGNKICCGSGYTATTQITAGAYAFACSSFTTAGLCAWTTSSACCDATKIASVGTIASDRSNTLCCSSAGPFATCSSSTTCPKDPSTGVNNPCCPATSIVTTCASGGSDAGLSFCCGATSGVTCTNAGSTSTATRRCCPNLQRPQVGSSSTTFADYCCASAGTTSNPLVYVSSTSPCCSLDHIPTNPTSGAKDYTVCCTNADQYLINGVCCSTAYAAKDSSGNWYCCTGTSSPTIVNGACCASTLNFNSNDYCCPYLSGRPSLATVTSWCPTAPTTSTTCWVKNADCTSIGGTGQTNNCCCYAAELSRSITNGPSLPTNAVCCNAGTQTSVSYYYTSNNACCPSAQATSNFRTTATSTADTAYCCPSGAGTLGVTIGSVACSYYTPLNDASGNSVTCCRNCDVSRDLTGAISTSTNARCCGASLAASIPTLVDVVATGTSANQACCPKAQVLTVNSQSICCPQSVAIYAYANYIGGYCCMTNQDVTNPNTAAQTCCPSYDTANGAPAWADYGPGLVNSACCPPKQLLTFSSSSVPSGATLPNVPTSNATDAPTSTTTKHAFCCALSQLSNTLPPTADSYLPAIDATGSGTTSFATAYTNLRCCAVPNVIKVLYNNKVYDVCCTSPGMIWNKDTLKCCAAGVITPACATPAPLAGCSGSCCATGTSGAIDVASNGIPNTASVPVCCATADIVSYSSTDYCCPSALVATTPTPSYDNSGTLYPCCAAANILTCSLAACNITTAPYKMCCPAANFPYVSGTSTNSPPPTIIIDPATGGCCRGYLNVAGGTGLPGGNKCCAARVGITTYYQASDDLCCTTMVNADGTCCATASFHTPSTCCDSGTVWASTDQKCCPSSLAAGLQANGTYSTCCDNAGYTNDPGHTCCLTTLLQNGYCCSPSSLDDFGHCCANDSAPLNKYIDVSTGVPVVKTNVSACCDSNLIDCAGFCYYLDPTSGVSQAYNVQGANGTGCCPESSLDCAGQCPDSNGYSLNNGTALDCCPDSERGCLNSVANTGACGAADTNCCEQYSGSNCSACIAKPGCGWCNSVGLSEGSCYSGDYFAPTAGVEGVACNASAGYRWTAAGESKIFLEVNGFNDGRSIEYANVSVLLAKGLPLTVTFKIKAPTDLPLDIYILQDRTNSFIQPVTVGSTYLQYGPLDVLKTSVSALDAAISALVPSGYHLGFGTFGDKAVEPFGYWDNSGWYDFVFENIYPISANREATIAAIAVLDPNSFAGGNDIPEGSLEALLHVAQNPVVGWGSTRTNSLGKLVPVNKIAVVVTDAPAHVAFTNWTGYAAGTRFPSVYFPTGSDSAKDLGYYLTADSAVAQQQIALLPVNSWKANSGSYLDTNCTSSDPSTARIRQPATAFDATRQGICSDYPSTAQVAGAIGTTGITTVFAVADTISTNYPLSAGYDFWASFGANDLPTAGASAGLPVHLSFSVDPTAEGGLVYTIAHAIQNITQSITFSNTTSSQFMTNAISSSFNLPPDGIQTVSVPLLWDGTDYDNGYTGPYTIDFQAIFPLSGYVIDVARINVYISVEKRCCFCGDGVVQTEVGCDEECDNDGTTNSTCCSSCQIKPGTVCAADNLCQPVLCAADGLCTTTYIQDTCINDVLDPLSFCQYNTCLAGSCVVTCNSDACCDDGDNCTDDACSSLALCQYTLKDVCDCSNAAFNNCFQCVGNNNTRCAWEANSGSCFSFNDTNYEAGEYGSGITVVSDEKGIEKYCVAVRRPSSKTGVIVGSVIGAVAALAIIALAAALWWRLSNGPLMSPNAAVNSAAGQSASRDNPTYSAMSGLNNPLHNPSL